MKTVYVPKRPHVPGRFGPKMPRAPQLLESMGPDGKIRGTAGQILEKYLTLAKEALSEGDRVMAERFFQYAEHYRRLNQERPQRVMRNKRPFFQESSSSHFHAEDLEEKIEQDIPVQPEQAAPLPAKKRPSKKQMEEQVIEEEFAQENVVEI